MSKMDFYKYPKPFLLKLRLKSPRFLKSPSRSQDPRNISLKIARPTVPFFQIATNPQNRFLATVGFCD